MGSNIVGWAKGSSPRMRGAPVNSVPDGLLERIIPADAGSTCKAVSLYLLMEDHPRGCGEHPYQGR